MNPEDKITDILHRKLGGLTFDQDVHSPKGTLLRSRPGKKAIAQFLRDGGLPALLDLLVPDPALLRSYGTQHIRKKMDRLAWSTQPDAHELSKRISIILRRNSKA
jgi:hypothetical protein